MVVTHKIISIAEGRILDLNDVSPSDFSTKVAGLVGKDSKQVEAILSESRRLVKIAKGALIVETAEHGFVCANAGIEESDIDQNKIAVLLPKRPDVSARKIRDTIRGKTKKDVAVIVSDAFGRPWREGEVNVAIGLSGIDPFADYRGSTDQYGYALKASVICIADELASAAELCMNKLERASAAIVRGYSYKRRDDASARMLSRKPARDLFR